MPWNSLPIDSQHRVDARLSKLLPLTESVRLYLNFEAFNLFNTISNTFVETEMYQAVRDPNNSAARILKPSPITGRGTQSQGFPDGTNARRAQVSLRVVF